MVAQIDPRKARLYPEILPEAIYVANPTVSGVSIASYANFFPWSMSLQYLNTNQHTDNSIRVDGDAGHGLLECDTLARADNIPSPGLDILVEDSMDFWAIGDAGGDDMWASYGLRITQLTVLEKIKYGIQLEDHEKALSDKFGIWKDFKSGRLQASGVINSNFKKITEVAKEITATANSTTTVDKRVNVKLGEKAVLLNIGSYGNFATADDTFLVLNRDVSDLTYFKLDTEAMPAENYTLPCYIPAVDRLEVTVQNTTVLVDGDLKVYFRYGVADLTVLEKIKWNQPMTPEDDAIASEFNLHEAVKAGVM